MIWGRIVSVSIVGLMIMHMSPASATEQLVIATSPSMRSCDNFRSFRATCAGRKRI